MVSNKNVSDLQGLYGLSIQKLNHMNILLILHNTETSHKAGGDLLSDRVHFSFPSTLSTKVCVIQVI